MVMNMSALKLPFERHIKHLGDSVINVTTLTYYTLISQILPAMKLKMLNFKLLYKFFRVESVSPCISVVYYV